MVAPSSVYQSLRRRSSVLDEHVDDRLKAVATNRKALGIDPESHDSLKKRLPHLFSPSVCLDALFLRWFGAESSQEAFSTAHSSNALLHGLLLEVAAHGVFHHPEEIGAEEEYGDSENNHWLVTRPVLIHAYTFLWCAAFLTFLYGALISVLLSAAVCEMKHDHQFNHFKDLTGKYSAQLPILLLWWGIFLLWLGLIVYIQLSNTRHFTVYCLCACSTVLFVYGISQIRMVWALQIAKSTQEHLQSSCPEEVDADDIYHELRSYFEEDCEGKRSMLRRSDFLNRFVVFQSEYVKQLASEIYDDWVHRMIQKELRQEIDVGGV